MTRRPPRAHASNQRASRGPCTDREAEEAESSGDDDDEDEEDDVGGANSAAPVVNGCVRCEQCAVRLSGA